MHSKVEPDSVEANEKLAEVDVVLPDGPLEIDVSGAVVSVSGGGEASDALSKTTEMVEVALLPAVSYAFAMIECKPSAWLVVSMMQE